MAIEMLDLSGTSEKSVFALIAGGPGIGKTSLALQFPIEDTVYVSAEKGELSLQGSGMTAISIKTQQDAIDMIGMIKEWPHRYWIIDSLSEYYDMIQDDARSKFTAKQNYAKSDEIKYWLMYFIKELRDIKSKDIFMLCHTKEEKNGPVVEHELCFDGKMPNEIKKQFDLVVHMTKTKDSSGKSERVFITSEELSKIAKIRKSPFLDVDVNDLEKPNLYELAKKLKGEK